MIDTHCHIDDPIYQSDLDTFITRQREGGVERIIVPGVNAQSIETVNTVCEKYPDYLFPCMGLHPTEIHEGWEHELVQIGVDVAEEHYYAIGETGLDYHEDVSFKDEQKFVFAQHLRWGLQYDLPIIVHSRDAIADTFEVIHSIEGYEHLRGVFHCFSGSHEVAEQIVQMGWYLGIGGVITFKNCKLKEALVGIPLEHILLETDAPYMSPVPHRGEPNESQWMRYVVEALTEVYKCSPEQVISATTQNAMKLFFP